MSEPLQLEGEVVALDDSPRLTVQWSSRWHEFLGSIGPALKRSEARLAGEAPFGLIPVRIMLPSYLLEACMILIAVFGYAKIEQLRPSVAPRLPDHDVIYYSGDELPRTEDRGGAEAGIEGRAGGGEARHNTQTIKVARGVALVPKVVDAPSVKLPATLDAVANLLAIKPNAGPPPAEGLRSTRSTPSLASTLVAPAPNVIRDYTRNGVQLDPVIAPAPSLSRQRPMTAPTLNAALAAPAPDIASDHTLVAPQLAPIVAPPSANIARDRALVPPTLTPPVAPPAEDVHRDPFRPAPALANNVVPPVPAAVSRQLSSAPVQSMDPAVVAPPVSAPEQVSVRTSQLSLPAPAIVAPPPSSDMHRLASARVPDPAGTVVPPPPAQAGSGSLLGSLIGRIFGPSETVTPPPAAVSRSSSGTPAPSLPANVVAPPSPTSLEATGNPLGHPNGRGATLEGSVVAPPPSTGVTGGTGRSRASAPYPGNPSVLPPPPALSGAGGGTGNIGGSRGSPAATLANNVPPPPPLVSGGASSVGSGLGRKGPGLAKQLDPGSSVTPPNDSGSGGGGAIISTQPGSKVGVPPNSKLGALSMSPAGSEKPGVGGAGGGTGIARGTSTGSSLSGAGPGAAKSGSGHGSDRNTSGGISLTSGGPGGSGSAASGTPPVRGVDISGGSGAVTLPSFGDDPAIVNPASRGRSTAGQHSNTLDVTVVATASSGGAFAPYFEPYKTLLHGEISTTYFDTSLGTVVMAFADAAPARGFANSLTAPAALRTDLAEGIPRARMVITCTLDAFGNIKNPRVLDAGPAALTAKILAALPSWKFQPAMRNHQPVEVTVILGFGINTDDHL